MGTKATQPKALPDPENFENYKRYGPAMMEAVIRQAKEDRDGQA